MKAKGREFESYIDKCDRTAECYYVDDKDIARAWLVSDSHDEAMAWVMSIATAVMQGDWRQYYKETERLKALRRKIRNRIMAGYDTACLEHACYSLECEAERRAFRKASKGERDKLAVAYRKAREGNPGLDDELAEALAPAI